jgi:GT2 family glycosyltransferase
MEEYLPENSYEWIVADNQSAETLQDQLARATYVRLESNFGFAKANNLASERASAPYLFFVNPDCVFVENCLPPLLDVMNRAGIAGPRVINEDGSLQLSFGPFLSIGDEWVQKRRMKSESTPVIQKWIRDHAESAAQYVSGCALMISSKLYREIGGFDENFFLYEEDVDLCKRVHDAGWEIRYVPSAAIMHKRNRSVQNDRPLANREYRRSQKYYYRKHHGWLQNALLKLYLSFIE